MHAGSRSPANPVRSFRFVKREMHRAIAPHVCPAAAPAACRHSAARRRPLLAAPRAIGADDQPSGNARTDTSGAGPRITTEEGGPRQRPDLPKGMRVSCAAAAGCTPCNSARCSAQHSIAPCGIQCGSTSAATICKQSTRRRNILAMLSCSVVSCILGALHNLG